MQCNCIDLLATIKQNKQTAQAKQQKHLQKTKTNKSKKQPRQSKLQQIATSQIAKKQTNLQQFAIAIAKKQIATHCTKQTAKQVHAMHWAHCTKNAFAHSNAKEFATHCQTNQCQQKKKSLQIFTLQTRLQKNCCNCNKKNAKKAIAKANLCKTSACKLACTAFAACQKNANFANKTNKMA